MYPLEGNDEIKKESNQELEATFREVQGQLWRSRLG
jgi:hypothetical protein